MATLVIMPRQGQSVESCVITSFDKKVGDTVAVDDILFTYETDKSSFEEKATVAGTILAVFADEGHDVPCLEPVCVIGNPGEKYDDLLPKTDAPATAAGIEAVTEKPAETAPAAVAAAAGVAVEGGRLKISPRAKNLAARTEADLSKAIPTGPNGRIIERDVNALLDAGLIIKPAAAEEKPAETAAAAPAASAPVAYTDVKLSNVRKVIAKSMHASLSTMAQLTLNSSFDATSIIKYRTALKANAEALGLENITYNDMVLYAVAKTLASGEFESVNAHYLENEGVLRCFSDVNLGIAVDTDRGLLVPTLFGADKLSLNSLAAGAKKVIKAAQSGSCSPDMLKGATITVTNLGSLGVESFTPVINPPQTCILGVCNLTRRVKETPAGDVFYTAMGLSLTFDHRALDGAPAARFLKSLCANLENFELLLAK